MSFKDITRLLILEKNQCLVTRMVVVYLQR